MLSYNEFKEFSIEEMKNYFPNGTVRNVTYHKANIKVDGMEIFEDKDSPVSGRIDLKELYETYKEETDSGKSNPEYGVIRKMAQYFYKEGNTNKRLLGMFEKGIDKTAVSNTLSFKLINTDQNQELLNDIPHRQFLDMSVTYYSTVGEGMTVTINNGILKYLGMTEQELYDIAYRNTKQQACIYDINDLMAHIFMDKECPNLLEDDSGYDFSEGYQLLVITNSDKMFGAGSMLISECMNYLAEKMDDDLYIIPSSLHECIAVPQRIGPAEYVAKMVYEVNMGEVNIRDRLSNNVYSFKKGDNAVTLSEYVSDKKIDGSQIQKENTVLFRNNPVLQGGGAI